MLDFKDHLDKIYEDQKTPKGKRTRSLDKSTILQRKTLPIINTHLTDAISAYFFNDGDYNKRRTHMQLKGKIQEKIFGMIKRVVMPEREQIREEYQGFPVSESKFRPNEETISNQIKMIITRMVSQINQKVVSIDHHDIFKLEGDIYNLISKFLQSPNLPHRIDEKSKNIKSHVPQDQLKKMDDNQRRQQAENIIVDGQQIMWEWLEKQPEIDTTDGGTYFFQIFDSIKNALVNKQAFQIPTTKKQPEKEVDKKFVNYIGGMINNFFNGDLREYFQDQNLPQIEEEFDDFRKNNIPQIQEAIAKSYVKADQKGAPIQDIINEAKDFYGKLRDVYKNDKEVREYFETVLKYIDYFENGNAKNNKFKDKDGEIKDIEDPVYALNTVVEKVPFNHP